jgi:hypothetical protein
MRLLRQTSKEILRRAVTSSAALAMTVFAAGCSAASGEENGTGANPAAADAAACESTSLDDPCTPAADNETADDEELNRDELERELDRIEQEIGAPEP